MTDIDRSKPVLVTGANGYVASWLVKKLLDEGLTVHGTVRDPANTKKVGHLLKLAEVAPGTLKLFAADLLSDGAFDEAAQGCELVFHTASPFIIRIRDPQTELVDPALNGTRNVLETCNRVESVKRVVLTTSVAAIYGDAADMTDAGLEAFTEAQWNTSSSLEHQPYSYSKTVAEKEAWRIAKGQERWDLVCINPALVLGPSLSQASDSTSLVTIKQLANGTMKPGAPALEFGIVDVRDVALAHYQAGFTPAAKGRHIVVSDTANFLDMAAIIRRHFGNGYPLPRKTLPKFLVWLVGPIQGGISRRFVSRNVGHKLRFDNSRAREQLGVAFRRVEDTIRDHFQQMLDDGLIQQR